jgi:hypothetical protein
VKPEVCRVERDALFECEAPGIGICLALCRQEQETQVDRAYDSETGLVNFSRLVVDGGPAPACPALDQPCEGLCFSVFGYDTDALSVALGSGDLTFSDAGPSDPSEVRSCIEDALLGCFLPGGGGDAGAPGPGRRRVRSIEDVLEDCAGIP